METKNEIRKKILLQRDSIPMKDRISGSEKIRARMLQFPGYRDADVILAYVSYRSEVDTTELIAQALTDGKQVFAPKVAGDEMEFWQIESLTDLQSGYQGIPEPVENVSYPAYCAAHRSMGEAVTALMWMPGAVFDKECNRIGYGKGFYDKYIECLHNKGHAVCNKEKGTLTTIALAYDCQVLEQIPCEPHDYRPDFILTERRLIEKTVHVTPIAKAQRDFMKE